MADLAIELQKIYDSEINVEIGWLWDGGVEVRLGENTHGNSYEDTYQQGGRGVAMIGVHTETK